MLGITLVCYVSSLGSSLYRNFSILMEVLYKEGPVKIMVTENEAPPEVTRTGTKILCLCISLLQSGSCQTDIR